MTVALTSSKSPAYGKLASMSTFDIGNRRAGSPSQRLPDCGCFQYAHPKSLTRPNRIADSRISQEELFGERAAPQLLQVGERLEELLTLVLEMGVIGQRLFHIVVLLVQYTGKIKPKSQNPLLSRPPPSYPVSYPGVDAHSLKC